ncbi:hypothetical protein TRICI_000571 [Trichomonascus ciferrii]|uniref:Uncharacterized protein n=1 Tax=Trichomonascus ciferrii TaxID=44093 RepID=A0A642VD27_9ASCO|nr:hypothetical protein TRICI_000571 [Trichomonascus ciferrii]
MKRNLTIRPSSLILPSKSESSDLSIESSSSSSDVEDPVDIITWTNFYANTWGQSVEALVSVISVPKINYVDVEHCQYEQSPEFCKVMATNLLHNKMLSEMLILQAYDEMLKELEARHNYVRKAKRKCGTVSLHPVKGSPTVGKTSFLLYVLITRLMQKLPTIFQAANSDGSPGCAYLFCSKGVYPIGTQSFRSLTKEYRRVVTQEFCQNMSKAEKRNIWVLLDSTKPDNYLLKNFAPSFKVQASGDNLNKLFHNSHAHKKFYMKNWKPFEIAAAQSYFRDSH